MKIYHKIIKIIVLLTILGYIVRLLLLVDILTQIIHAIKTEDQLIKYELNRIPFLFDCSGNPRRNHTVRGRIYIL